MFGSLFQLHFCCGSSMLDVMSVCIWSSAIWSSEEQLPIMLHAMFCFVIENRNFPSVCPSAVEHSCPLHNFDTIRDNFTKLGRCQVRVKPATGTM